MDWHFQALDYCEQKGCCVCVPAKVRMVTAWLTLRDGPGLPCPSFLLFPSKDVPGFSDGSSQAGLESCCWPELGTVCVSVPSHTRQDPVQSPPACHRLQQGVCECSWTRVAAAGSCRLCLPLLIPPSTCMDLLGSQWRCQRNHHLPLEHFGSVGLDLSALFSVNRAFFTSSGANVRALWICAERFGACWWCALFAHRWSCCEGNATEWWGKGTGS